MSKCFHCGKNLYAAERVVADDKEYHPMCLISVKNAKKRL